MRETWKGMCKNRSWRSVCCVLLPSLTGFAQTCEISRQSSNLCANGVRLASNTQQAIRHDRFLNIPFPGCGLPTVRLAVRSDAYTVASVGHESRSGAG